MDRFFPVLSRDRDGHAPVPAGANPPARPERRLLLHLRSGATLKNAAGAALLAGQWPAGWPAAGRRRNELVPHQGNWCQSVSGLARVPTVTTTTPLLVLLTTPAIPSLCQPKCEPLAILYMCVRTTNAAARTSAAADGGGRPSVVDQHLWSDCMGIVY
ncbi:hypothetical protein Q1695_011356 [Nippostrongylus brasiliensis]|nr:hypothetical protein Q1695_011356 [Nippostrongylus brasiliensis]